MDKLYLTTIVARDFQTLTVNERITILLFKKNSEFNQPSKACVEVSFGSFFIKRKLL